MVYTLAGLVAITIGFVTGRFSSNLASDLVSYLFPPPNDEAPRDYGEFKNAGAAIGAIGALAWCEVALLCGSPLWAVLGALLGGIAFPLLFLLIFGFGVLCLLVIVLAAVIISGGCHYIGKFISAFGRRVDKVYARAKGAPSAN